jgi:transcriptional regulator with XRE-family HTH domain
MAYPAYLREKARELRIKRKLSLLEIAERLALPKTTVFYWIRDLPNPEIKYGDTPARARARAKAARRKTAKYKAVRDAAYRQGWEEFPQLAREPTFTDFVCMYIGEGYKRDRNRVSLGNSDPRVVRLADHWMRRFSRNPVRYMFQYHADQDPDYLVRFWSFGLDVDRALIKPQRKSNSGRLSGRTWRSKYGVMTVIANDTSLRARVQAWMDRTQDQWLDSLGAGVWRSLVSHPVWGRKTPGSNPGTPIRQGLGHQP